MDVWLYENVGIKVHVERISCINGWMDGCMGASVVD